MLDPRIAAFVRGIQDRCATRAERFEHGVALFHEELTRVWDVNFLRVESGATAAELVLHAERLQRDLGHRKLSLEDPDLGRRLESDFRLLGWEIERHLFMTSRDPAARQPDVTAVREATAEELRAVWAQGIREQPHGREKEVVEQLLRLRDVVAGAVPTKFFAAYVDGVPASYCELYFDGTVAQIESVVTLQAYRDRGLGSAVVERARQEVADHDVVFLVADADDWPKELYRRLGFDDAAVLYRFRRSA